MSEDQTEGQANGRRVITIFGGSRCQPGDAEYEESLKLGRLLAEQGYIVCTGGYYGVMEAISRGAHEAGGDVIGVTMNQFKATPNSYLKKIVPSADFYSRLQVLIRQSDAYIAMRGGMGTVTEVSLVWNKLVTKVIEPPKPHILVGACWRKIVQVCQENLTVTDADIDYLTFVDTAEEAVAVLQARLAPAAHAAER